MNLTIATSSTQVILTIFDSHTLGKISINLTFDSHNSQSFTSCISDINITIACTLDYENNDTYTHKWGHKIYL